MNSFTEENYLKTIYALSSTDKNGVSTNLIAEKLKTKASSVTDMMKKLAVKELVYYKKYYGVILTEKGQKVALSIIRNHRLWEVFLVEKLHFKWNEVHEIAEELEHVKSEKLIDGLDAFLNYPSFDPHGDPIPNSKGEIKTINKVCMTQLNINQEGIFVYVKNATDLFLNYLSKNQLELGKKIKLLEREPFDQSLKIKVNHHEMVISKNVAQNIYLKTND
ncbi:MAG: metal-dependent transcriptional regulator [Lutibacter sp.]